jgi:hypothetical protein
MRSVDLKGKSRSTVILFFRIGIWCLDMAAFDGGLFEYDPQISRRTRHQKHVTLNTSVTTKEVSLIF